MKITMTKASGDKSGTLTVTRDDGSQSYQPSTPYFALHDLIHYAVETTLGYQNAFWGHVAQGKGMDDYGTQNGVKDTYTVEEGWAENIVALLQWTAANYGGSLSDEDFFAQLAEVCTNSGVAAPVITAAQLKQIREKTLQLHEQWARVLPGERLELDFNV